jgi:hypothetical protein
MDMEVFREDARIKRAVLGFGGWTDAGDMVQQVLATLRTRFASELIASWDLDGFWHTESLRPRVSVQHGLMKRLEWPAYRFFALSPPSGETVLLGTGDEPACRWRQYAGQLLQRLRQWGCQELYLLGSLYDQVYYDEALISGVASDTWGLNLLHELECGLVEYEGPGAVQSSILESASRVEMASIMLWSHLPFYLKCPHELVLARYLRIVGRLTGLEVETEGLMRKWDQRLEEIEELIAGNQELGQLIGSIKEKRSEGKDLGGSPSKVVSFDEFLRKRHHGPGEED